MWWARVLIFGIPLAVLSTAGWAAWQTRSSRLPRADALTVMLPGSVPALDPFRPADEAERQMLDLLHEPLLRLGRDGRPSPALAEQWGWHRTVTCWFGSADLAQKAARRLQALTGNPWVASQLAAATAQADAVVMRFVRPDDPGATEALRSIADLKPVQLAVLQIRGQAPNVSLLRKFAQERPDVVKRIWFDGEAGCELVTTQPAPTFQATLAAWLRVRQSPPLPVRPLGDLTGLIEAVLEFHLRSGARWPDGSPVTAGDVRATFEWVRENAETVPALAGGFQQVQRVEAQGAERVRVIYRTHAGAALASWVGLPILPAIWLQAHAPPWSEPPPGAGPFTLSERTRDLILLTRTAGRGIHRLRFSAAAPARKVRTGLATKTLDVIWPAPQLEAELRADEALEFHVTPARNRLLVIWNTRSRMLAHPQVREALELATDRRALVQQLLQGQGRLVEGLFPPEVWFGKKDGGGESEPDLQRAGALLAEAGWMRDVSGLAKSTQGPLDLELVIAGGNPWRRRLAEALAAQWIRIGARVTVSETEAGDLVDERLHPGRFDAVLLGLDFELSWDQRLFWHSSAIAGGMNFAGVADAQLDLLLDALAVEYDPDRIAARAHEVAERLGSLHAFIPLFSDLQQVAIRRDRFPGLAQSSEAWRLRDLLGQGPAPAKTRQNLQMIMPDE